MRIVEILLTAHTLCRSDAAAAHTSSSDSLWSGKVPVPHREHTGHTGVTCDPRLNVPSWTHVQPDRIGPRPSPISPAPGSQWHRSRAHYPHTHWLVDPILAISSTTSRMGLQLTWGRAGRPSALACARLSRVQRRRLSQACRRERRARSSSRCASSRTYPCQSTW